MRIYFGEANLLLSLSRNGAPGGKLGSLLCLLLPLLGSIERFGIYNAVRGRHCPLTFAEAVFYWTKCIVRKRLRMRATVATCGTKTDLLTSSCTEVIPTDQVHTVPAKRQKPPKTRNRILFGMYGETPARAPVLLSSLALGAKNENRTLTVRLSIYCLSLTPIPLLWRQVQSILALNNLLRAPHLWYQFASSLQASLSPHSRGCLLFLPSLSPIRASIDGGVEFDGHQSPSAV